MQPWKASFGVRVPVADNLTEPRILAVRNDHPTAPLLAFFGSSDKWAPSELAPELRGTTSVMVVGGESERELCPMPRTIIAPGRQPSIDCLPSAHPETKLNNSS